MGKIKNFLFKHGLIENDSRIPKIIPFLPLNQEDKIELSETIFENLNNTKQTTEIELNPIDLDSIDPDDLLNNNLEVSLKQIPIDWFVFEMGQSPIDKLWFCQLVEINSALTDESDDFSNVKHVVSVDKKTLCLAILECLTKIENEDYAINDND